MKSFDDIINDKKSLNEGLYAEWKKIFDGIDQPSRVERMLLDIMQKLDSIDSRHDNGPRWEN